MGDDREIKHLVQTSIVEVVEVARAEALEKMSERT